MVLGPETAQLCSLPGQAMPGVGGRASVQPCGHHEARHSRQLSMDQGTCDSVAQPAWQHGPHPAAGSLSCPHPAPESLSGHVPPYLGLPGGHRPWHWRATLPPALHTPGRPPWPLVPTSQTRQSWETSSSTPGTPGAACPLVWLASVGRLCALRGRKSQGQGHPWMVPVPIWPFLPLSRPSQALGWLRPCWALGPYVLACCPPGTRRVSGPSRDGDGHRGVGEEPETHLVHPGGTADLPCLGSRAGSVAPPFLGRLLWASSATTARGS